MMKLRPLTFALLALSLAACGASEYTLRNPKTGETRQCKKGFWGTVYSLQECVELHQSVGYVIVPNATASSSDSDDDDDMPHGATPTKTYVPKTAPAAPTGAMPPAAPSPYAPSSQAVPMPYVPAPGSAAAAAAPEEKPYFSQYPSSDQRPNLPSFLK